MRSSLVVLAILIAVSSLADRSTALSDLDPTLSDLLDEQLTEGNRPGCHIETWPCCNTCGNCTRSCPPICTCQDKLKSCPRWCKNCVSIQVHPIRYVCKDRITNYCEHKCDKGNKTVSQC